MLAALVLASMPPRPALRSLPLPAKLAGGLFLFKTSVPAADKPFAGKLLAEAQHRRQECRDGGAEALVEGLEPSDAVSGEVEQHGKEVVLRERAEQAAVLEW